MLLSADLRTKNGIPIVCASLSLLCHLLPGTATVLPFGAEHSVFKGNEEGSNLILKYHFKDPNYVI